MARDFNGSTDRLDFQSAMATTGRALTISIWAQFDIGTPGGGTSDYIVNSAVSGGGAGTFISQSSGGAGRLQFARLTSGTTRVVETNDNVVSTTGWHHILCTDTGLLASGSTAFYINGASVGIAVDTAGTGTETAADSGYSIGARASDDLRNFDGRFSAPGLWSRVLTPHERALLAKGFDPFMIKPGLVWAPDISYTIRERVRPGGLVTIDGTISAADPKLIRPGTARIYSFPTAAPGGFKAAFARNSNTVMNCRIA